MYATGLKLRDELMKFWITHPMNMRRVERRENWLEEVLGEYGEESEECEEGENRSVREKVGGDEKNGGDRENGEDEETKVLQTLESQK